MRLYNVYDMSSTSTPTRPARGLVVPGIDTHTVFDQTPCLSQQTQSFSGWGPLTPPSSAQDSRRPSLAFSSMSDATVHSGTSSLSAFSQPATPVHSMASSADSFVHQWHETTDMHAALPAQMESACNLPQPHAMCDMSYSNGLPDVPMHMSDTSPMREEMWQGPQHASFGPALQLLGQPHAQQHASMYANPSASMTASLEQSVFPNCGPHAFHAQPRVVVPSQLGPQHDYPMDHYPQYDQNESMSRDFAQSFDSNMSGHSGWESVGPPSPMAAYMEPAEEDYVMVKDEFIKDEFATTPTKSRVFGKDPVASRVQRRSSRKLRTSRASGNVFYQKDTGFCVFTCAGKRFRTAIDDHGKKVIIPETPPEDKQNRCTFRMDDMTICSASFFRAEHLKRHMLKHSDERAFPCPLPKCKGNISRSDNASDHFMTHLREKTKGKRNEHFSIDQIEQYLRNDPAWDEQKVAKMIGRLHQRLARSQEQARQAAAAQESQLAVLEMRSKRPSSRW
ncbi:hypothetical protein BST61_g432 [Cercospora zeina]